jgi:membrane associated rhomboid family serine protease
MNTPPQVMLGFPKPGRALKVVLVAILVLGIFNALLATWVPHGEQVFAALVCDFGKLREGQLWRIVSSGLLTSPDHYGHLFFTLLGLYFLAPDLEKRWGDGRFLRFIGLAVITGNLAVLAVDLLTPDSAQGRFHPQAAYGASAAIAAVAVAWSRLNADRTVNIFFVLPMRGRWLLWVTLAFCVLDLIYPTAVPEGIVAPFGGVAVGLLLGGTPSLLRTGWLHLKLAVLRRRAGSLTVDDVLSAKPRRRPRPSSGPPLRVVQGGLEDALKKRTPPKDKRYLN